MKKILSCFLLIGLFISVNAEEKKPLKVFILVGQSNMEGHAKLSSFDHVGMDPETAPMLAEMRGKDGKPTVCERVWISYFTNGGEGYGKLTAGYGSRRDPKVDGGKIGPEFTFGIYAEKALQEPVLIIKTAWGGKSIHTDFRPPSAGLFVFREETLKQQKERGKDVEKMQAEKKEATGKYYKLMMDHVKAVLADPGRVCPAYDKEAGVELAGMVWFQGWNDMVARDVYPTRDKPGGYDAYSEVMAHFIRDVRKDLDAPNMPFVIGVMGVNGPTALYDEGQKRYLSIHQNFRDAMAAPATMDEFEGNVFAVLTEKYWDKELDAVAKKRSQIQSLEKTLRNEKAPRAKITAEVAKLEAELYTARDKKLLTGITNADYHYKGSAKILGGIGKAFAEALVGEVD